MASNGYPLQPPGMAGMPLGTNYGHSPEEGSSSRPYGGGYDPSWSPDGGSMEDAEYGEAETPEDDEQGRNKRARSGAAGDGKPKATRGSKACIPCRKLKMRCVGAESGDPCQRCVKNGHPQNCTFEPSQRGKRRNHKTEAMQKTVEKLEATLDTVLQSIRTSDPALLIAAGGMIASRPPADHRAAPSVAPLPSPAIPFSAPAAVPISTAVEMPTLTAWAESGRPNGASLSSSANASRPPSPRLHSLPDNNLNPLGLLAEASLTNARGKRREELEASDTLLPGIADPKYFQPGPISILPLRRFVIEHRMAPSLLVDKVVTPEEVVELFDIYFRFCSHNTSLLVEEIHTPTNTGARSPFLFTCICAVASRYYTKRPELCAELSRRAFELATDVIVQGYKSVEVIQGFFLLALWSQPTARYEQDRTWQFTGIALRLATDLNLFRKTHIALPDSLDETTKSNYRREILNRERTWMYCFVVDRSMSTLLGKPPTIMEDAIIRSAKTWYMSPENSPYDINLMAMVEMHRLNGRIVDVLYSSTTNTNGLNHDLNFNVLMRNFARDLEGWMADWKERGMVSPAKNEQSAKARDALRTFYWRYYSLVFLGCGLQHAVEIPDASLDIPTAYSRCFIYAIDLVETALYRLAPIGILTFMNDSMLLMLTYGATFLLKLTKPVFRGLGDEAKCFRLVEELANALEKASMADTVGPALYASFLRALLKSRNPGNGNSAATPAREQTPSILPENKLFNGGLPLDPMLGVPSNHPTPRPDTTTNLEVDPLSGFWNDFLLPGFGGEPGLPQVLGEESLTYPPMPDWTGSGVTPLPFDPTLSTVS